MRERQFATPADVGSLGCDGIEDATALLARAFRDSPLNRAVMPRHSPRARVRKNAPGMRSQLRRARCDGVVFAAWQHAGLVGILIGVPPYGYPLPLPSPGERLRTWIVQGPSVAGRWAQAYAGLEAVHPPYPHWYLSTLGVDPDRWGRGVGALLLERFLAHADGDAAPVYLETDNPRNLAFYERAGFRVERELELLQVPVWCMRRPAVQRPGSAASSVR